VQAFFFFYLRFAQHPKGAAMHYQINENSNYLLKLDTVKSFTGLSKSSIYSFIKNGSFPMPIRIGKRAVAWRTEDLEKWVNSRPFAALNGSSGEKS
jgi:prophage regulatory protein